MGSTRDIMTAGSQSSTATDLFGVAASGRGSINSYQMLTGLYQELEPQLCKSYRRHVVIEEPGDVPEPKVTITLTDSKRKNKLKTVNMAIDVVSELQRKKDTSKFKKDGAKIDLKDFAGKAADMAKSLPNLLATTKSEP